MTCLFSQPPLPLLAPLPVPPPFILKRFKDEELKLPAILVTPGLPNNQFDPNELSRLAPEVADAMYMLSQYRSASGSTSSGSKSHRTRSPHPWFIHSYTPDRRAILGWPITSCGHSLEEKERFFAILKPDLHNFVIPLDSISREASPVHPFCPSQGALTYTNPQAAQNQANPIEGFVILQGEARFEVEHLVGTFLDYISSI